MKKLMISIVLAFALLSGYSAEAANAGSKTMNSSFVTQSKLKFESIDVSKLPGAVTKSVSTDYKDAKISEASVASTKDGAKIYRVVLQLNGQSMIAMYKEDGSKYKPE